MEVRGAVATWRWFHCIYVDYVCSGTRVSHSGGKWTFFIQKFLEPSLLSDFQYWKKLKCIKFWRASRSKLLSSPFVYLQDFDSKYKKFTYYLLDNFLRFNDYLGKLYNVLNQCIWTQRIKIIYVLIHLIVKSKFDKQIGK